MSKAVGIDFGTTNSVIAVLEGGEPVIIPNARGERLTPSVVGFTREGEILIGSAAKHQAIINCERTAASVKRKLDSDFSLAVDEREFSAEQLASLIIHQLVKDAAAYLGEPVTDAVVTVPAYFNDVQRKRVKAAGEMAGLNVLRIINEPTAASLAFGLPRNREGQVLIFDLGGGTFDVSVLDISGKVYEVVATRGNNALGGDDFDARLADYIRDDFYDRNSIDLRGDRMAMQKVREIAEQVKKDLSSMASATAGVPFISADEFGPKHLEMTVTREIFEDLICDRVAEMDAIVEDCLADAGIDAQAIDAVVLVGGSTRIPCVQAMLEAKFGARKIMKTVNPDESVAAGAAIQAGIMTGNVSGLVLVDVAPLSLGIETSNDLFVPVIERNTCIPASRSRIFTTVADFQTQVDVHVLQGERPQASNNFSLGRFQLTGIKPAPRGEPRIEVIFDIDVNGIVHVSARDSETGARQEIVIGEVKKVAASDIERQLKQAAANRDQDEVFLHRSRLIGMARTLHERLRSRMQSGDGAAENNQELLELIAFIESALQEQDIAQIKSAIDAMKSWLGEVAVV